ncbi:MAG: translation initiation factor IF-2 N-terminal domain-containing protein, partial [Ruminococcus sp.]|nr:translation initiation factor IF-2 N-terminal domain-containing protein [Ruminococcus sp.]
MTKKIKISDAAKDFNVSVQDIVDFFSAKDNKKRNASSSLNEAEMNLLLEHYTKKHEVKNFDSYYQSRNDEKPAKKDDRQEKKNSGRKNDRNNKQSAPAKKSDKKPEPPKKQETPVSEQPKEK